MIKNTKNMAIFIEFIVGSGLAIFFHFVLHQEMASYITFGIGLLISLATYLLKEDIEATSHKLMKQYHEAHELTFAVAAIADPECHARADEIMAATKRTLLLLQQGYIPHDETEFYMKGARYMDESARCVKAVDPVTIGWDSRGALVNYYQANLRALERGVHILRIFVIQPDELMREDLQKTMLAQLKVGIDVRIAFRDELPTTPEITGHDTTCSFDFAIYDDSVATEVYSQPGKYFGRTTRERCLVAGYARLFDLVEHSSHAVAVDGDRVILAADLLAQAS